MIFCVEDDKNIRELILYTLQNTGFITKGFGCAGDFFKELEENIPLLILLDIMLPEEDGISILKKLRANTRTKNIPVIMLTAKSSEYDKVFSLDTGADDYITKPFSMIELISRIKALLRRSQKNSQEEYVYKNIKLNINSHNVYIDNQLIELTLKEFDILQLLLKNLACVLTRDMLLENIWGYDFDGETRTVDVHIRTLRKKLGKQGNIIETIRGLGYRIGGKIE